MTTIITGAPVRIRRRNNQTWLFVGRVKIGRVVGDVLEIKGHGKGNPTERTPLADVGRALVAMSESPVDKHEQLC